MQLLPSDPDVQTLVSRIKSGQIDMQPDFQRGVVWPEVKRRSLIDSILRDWHVPPIHVIRDSKSENQVVLDGHQRLASIFDFASNRLRADGSTDPSDPEIRALDGLFYKDLPERYQRRFDRFTIRVFTIINYQPEEPYELFFRLNQPMALTSSEKRNAFFGPARSQVRSLVALATSRGLSRDRVGFSNTRLAYDDILSRFCIILEHRSLRHKIDSWMVTDKYRSGTPFASETISIAESSISDFVSLPCFDTYSIKLNKATLQSWLCFAARRSPHMTSNLFSTFVAFFEKYRDLLKLGEGLNPRELSLENPPVHLEHLVRLFNDRAAARVTDVSSVLIRDAALWIAAFHFRPQMVPQHLYPLLEQFSLNKSPHGYDFEQRLMAWIERHDWGILR